MQVAGARDAVTTFCATVKLSFEPGAAASASVAQSLLGVPESLTATCSADCTLEKLLGAVVEAIKEICGWQTGSETFEAWNDKVAHLFAGCPYADELEKKIKDALADGQKPITVERWNVKKYKHIKITGLRLGGKRMAESAEWNDVSDSRVRIDKTVSDDKKLSNMKAKVGNCIVNGTFTVHGTIKRPTTKVRIFACTVQ